MRAALCILLLPLGGAAGVPVASAPSSPVHHRPEQYAGLGHTLPITAAAWSPDGRTLATGSADHTVVLWDRATWRPRISLAGHTAPIRSLAWSPNSRRLVSSDEGTIAIIWDAATGHRCAALAPYTEVWVFGRPSSRTYLRSTDRISSLVWSPDGKQIAGTDDGRGVHLWEIATGRQRVLLPPYEGTSGAMNPLAWSPDGKSLAAPVYTANKLACLVWDVATGRSRAVLPVVGQSYPHLAWSPRGTRLAVTTDDRQVALWDTATGKLWRTLILQALPPYDSWAAPRALLAWQPEGTCWRPARPAKAPSSSGMPKPATCGASSRVRATA